MLKKDKGRLGRGLSALMADIEVEEKPIFSNDKIIINSGIVSVPIERVKANPNQPRRDFNLEELNDLTSSIIEHGVIQPIIVRQYKNKSNEYQIVAGERRWRACQKAKLHEIPVLIREMSDQEVLEVAIIENVQRTDLNAVEEAMGYRALMDGFGHTQEQVSKALGKSRSYIANLLRLLSLPQDILSYVRQGKLTIGHARPLIGHNNASFFAREIIKKNLTVRQVEVMVKIVPVSKGKKRLKSEKDTDTRALESDLSAHIGMKISINHRSNTEFGVISISYKSLDDLDKVCSLLSKG